MSKQLAYSLESPAGPTGTIGNRAPSGEIERSLGGLEDDAATVENEIYRATPIVALVNPNLAAQEGDILGSGIPYLPIGLASLAAVLREKGKKFIVIDAFGEAPHRVSRMGNLLIYGLSPDETARRIPADVGIVFVYLWSVMSHRVVSEIVSAIRVENPHTKIIALENVSAVTSYSIAHCLPQLRDHGFHAALIGECENAALDILDWHTGSKSTDAVAGLVDLATQDIRYDGRKALIPDLDRLPIPAWDLFPLEEYWSLGYSHGPFNGPYVPLLTSRGCPFDCSFCVVPALSDRKWRGKRPDLVVDEMEHWVKARNVRDFHFEDVNPTTDEKRIIGLCDEISKRRLNITWKLASGTKIETLSLDTLDRMRAAGCVYISFSPETGSRRVLDLMGKPFRHDLALRMTRQMSHLGIRSQACFVIGFPGEKKEDLRLTSKYIRRLVRHGVDEIALFIMTPIPGTRTFGSITGYTDLSELTFSPSWRADYAYLARIRKRLYLQFLLFKVFFQPLRVARQFMNIARHSYETKMEMTVFRLWKRWTRKVNCWVSEKEGNLDE